MRPIYLTLDAAGPRRSRPKRWNITSLLSKEAEGGQGRNVVSEEEGSFASVPQLHRCHDSPAHRCEVAEGAG